MNNSSYAYVHVDNTFSESIAVFLVVMTTLLAIATVVWNCILIVIILRTPILHTLTNAVIVSVAVSDLLTGLLVMPFSAVTWYCRNMPFSDEACSVVGFIASLCSSSISFGILAVSLDRCAAMSRPLQYNHFINKKSISAMICTVWSSSLFLALLPFFGWGTYGYSNYLKTCMISMFSQTSYTVMKLVTCHILPAIAIVITLVIILNEARSHHRVITIAQLAIAMYSGPAAATGINYSRNTFRAMRTFLIIVIIHLTMHFPLPLYKLTVTTNRSLESRSIFIFLTFLCFISCLATPVTIATLNSKFKLSLQLMFKPKNKVSPGVVDSEAFTISTGLHSVLEASMAMKFLPAGHLSRDACTTTEPGTSGQTSSRFPRRKISVLQEVNSSSSSSKSSVDKQGAFRKSSSFPT